MRLQAGPPRSPQAIEAKAESLRHARVPASPAREGRQLRSHPLGDVLLEDEFHMAVALSPGQKSVAGAGWERSTQAFNTDQFPSDECFLKHSGKFW